MSDHASEEPLDPTAAWAEPPGIGRALLIGSTVGPVLAFVGVGGAFLAGGQGWGAAIGMGAFIALWGGLGFGIMVAGVIWATRVDEAGEADAPARSGQAPQVPAGASSPQ